jgi:hypothetical protein
MRKLVTKTKVLGIAAAMMVFAALGFAQSASAHTGLFSKFDNCPSTNPTVFKCLDGVTKGGKVVLGKKTVPIVNPVTIQGGETNSVEGISHFVAAANGVPSLSKTPQPVPGGLAGLVNCKEISNFILRTSCEWTFENGLTGVNVTLELARPASEILVNEFSLFFEENSAAMQLPVKVHLENPLLGSSCYVGSSSSPIIWNLTTGATSPPPPNTSIHGATGELEFPEEAEILEITENKLVDNAWSAPHATGCGGFLVELILDPIIDSSVGTPSAAGKNTAILENTTLYVATADAVNEH